MSGSESTGRVRCAYIQFKSFSLSSSGTALAMRNLLLQFGFAVAVAFVIFVGGNVLPRDDIQGFLLVVVGTAFAFVAIRFRQRFWPWIGKGPLASKRQEVDRPSLGLPLFRSRKFVLAASCAAMLLVWGSSWLFVSSARPEDFEPLARQLAVTVPMATSVIASVGILALRQQKGTVLQSGVILLTIAIVGVFIVPSTLSTGLAEAAHLVSSPIVKAWILLPLTSLVYAFATQGK